MADIALRTYYKQIDQLIDQKHLEEALAYCKNILHHFPKDLEAYRLMGKTLLERGRHGDAADVFQRVLSAQPDDFISHVGMAIVREDEGNLEAALWHMERAFESSPSNPAVQDELRRLYGRRDGIVPHRAQLTRGALARLYFKQGLYAQAETELRAGLAEQPDRPDLITLLVQVLWENGHRGEAGTLCSDLLQRLPHNLEANRVMAQIATAENRADDARACRARLEALDPYEAFATAGMSATSVNADAVRIAEIAYSPELSTPSQPDWSNALGADLHGQTEDVLPDWVKSGTSLLVSDGPTDPTKVGAAPDLPDWMRATTGILTGALTGAPAESTPETTDLNVEPAEPAEEPPATPTTDFLPDWLSEAAAPTTAADAAPDGDWLSALSTPEAAPPGPAASEELPDWLRGAADDAGDNTPEWMRQSSSAPSGAASDWMGAAETKAPEWLSRAADAADAEPSTDTPAQADAPLTAAALGAAGAGALLGQPEPDARPAVDGDLPDWLTSAAGQGTPDVPDWLSGAAAKTDDQTTAPDWMRTDAPAPADDSVFATDAPDWLRGATGQTGMLGGAAPSDPTPAPSPEPFVEDDGVEASADVPAWLAAARPAEEPAALDETVPDWLSAAATDTGSLGELPDWLKASEPAVTDVTLPAATVEEPPIPEATVDVRAVDPTPTVNAGDIDLPDWLNAAAEAPASAGESTEPGAFDADAFAWLEGLAARQGADPETLSTPAPDTGDDVPDWLKSASEATSIEQATPAADVTPGTPNDDDAFTWLEGLAARQGADPETLSTAPSEVELPDFLQPASPEAIERANTPVDWSDANDESVAAVDATQGDADEGAMPDWIKALAPSADEATAAPLETLPDVDPDDLPDWLRPTDTAAPATSEAVAPAPEMSGDAAFAWLEGLAAAQGADPATLSTPETAQSPKPNDLPDWLTQTPEAPIPAQSELAEAAAAPLAAAPVDAGAADDDAAFAWLESLAAAQGADPGTLSAPATTTPAADLDLPDWLTSEPEAPASTQSEATPAAALTPTDAADDAAAFAWLESLAAAQGADPATLSTSPEATPAQSEPAIDLPDWLSGEVSLPATDTVAADAAEPPADRKATRPLPTIETEDVDLQGVAWLRTPIENEAPPADAAEITLPDWLQDEIAPQTSILTPPPVARAEEPSATEPPAEPEAPAGPPITTSDKRTALLAGKLADRKRAREAEIQDKFERQRAAREAAQREIENKLANRRAGVAPEPSELPTAPLPALDATPTVPEPAAAPRPSTGPLDLGRPRWRPRGTPAFVDVAPDALLARSREQLAGGQEAVAMSGYTHLIKTGHQVDAILAELQSHVGRGKAGAIAYRALGDAQMKVGRLQDALASYRAALDRA